MNGGDVEGEEEAAQNAERGAGNRAHCYACCVEQRCGIGERLDVLVSKAVSLHHHFMWQVGNLAKCKCSCQVVCNECILWFCCCFEDSGFGPLWQRGSHQPSGSIYIYIYIYIGSYEECQ